MERRRKISWLPVQADWSEEGRDNGVCFQVREGIKYWCDSEEDPESDPEDEPDLDDRCMKLGFMCCNGCQKIKPPEHFHDSVKEKWKGRRYDEVLCLTCAGSPMSKSEVQSFHCYGILCQGQSRPAYHFIDAMLTERRAKDMLSDLQCARCWVRSLDCEESQRAAECKKRCVSCKSEKPIIDFGPAYVKQWLRKISKGDCWRCYECQYPACRTPSCGKRPVHAILHYAAIAGQYYCLECKYPACAGIDNKGCGNRRANPRAKNRFQPYICGQCRPTANEAGAVAKVEPACGNCGMSRSGYCRRHGAYLMTS
jgi:hypothetical protein